MTSYSSVFNAECTHFAKIMQNGAVKLGFLTKNLSKILEFGVGVKRNLRDDSHNIILGKDYQCRTKGEFDMFADKNLYIESAYQTLQVIRQDKQKRLGYEAREKAIWNHNQFLFETRQKGRKEEKSGFADEFLELSLFFKAFRASYSKLICIFPCFCPYEYFTRAAFNYTTIKKYK